MKEVYKDHPIVDAPFRYKVVDFSYHRSLEDPEEKWIDMVLQKGDEIVISYLNYYKKENILKLLPLDNNKDTMINRTFDLDILFHLMLYFEPLLSG